MPSTVITETHIPETPTLKFVSRGKVRDLYEVTDPSTSTSYLLFIATDRISAYDVVLKNVSLPLPTYPHLVASKSMVTSMHALAYRAFQTKALS